MLQIILMILMALAGIAGSVFLLLVIYFLIPFRRAWATTEADYTHHITPWWQFYYLHKYLWLRTKPAKGSGLEAYFRSRSFDFNKGEIKDRRELSIMAVGDLMVRRDLLDQGGEHLWDELGEYIFSGDLRIGNLECAINEDWVIEKTVRYSVPATYAEPLLGDERFGRFDYVTLGNNHVNDSLSAGIRRTCEYLDSVGVRHSGANRTIEEQDEIPIFEVKGVKNALLAYSFSTNGVPIDEEAPFGVNIVRFNALDDANYDDSLIRRHIKLAK